MDDIFDVTPSRKLGYDMLKQKLIEGKDINFSWVLDRAIEHGRVDIVDLLLGSKKYDVNCEMISRRKAIHMACIHNKIDIVKRLIYCGAIINDVDIFGNTPLHYAADGACEEILDILFVNGGLVNVQNKNGETPLARATLSDNIDAVKRLVSYGCDINMAEKNGWTPVMGANLDITKILVAAGCDLNLKNKNGHTALSLAINSHDTETADFLKQHMKNVD